jgi:pantoate--beta-alanine ligase
VLVPFEVAGLTLVPHFSSMRIVKSVKAMQRLAQGWREHGVKVGFVPTMGSLHEGHLSLVRRARQLIGPGGRVVVSIYVNPTQFGVGEDFSRYPRDLSGDARLCRGAGVDVLFAPTDQEMYPRGDGGAFSTYVFEETLSRRMEGASRPTHFRGVTTVVAKLFNIIQPSLAVFGAKDYQQAAVVQRMVRDLNFPVKVVVAPTHREHDGLAMSSRNQYLTGALRGQAVVLWRAILEAQEMVRASSNAIPASRLRARLKKLIAAEPDARLDYVEFFQPETLAPVTSVALGTHMALAVFLGKTRLIDNARL